MKDYEMRDEVTRCHAFLFAKSQAELLAAVSEWWAPKDAEPGTVIEVIQFWIDDSYNCHVYWCSMPEGFDFEAELKKVRDGEHANPLKLPKL